MNLRFVLIEGKPEIFASKTGFIEQTFTDADFQGLNSCDKTHLHASQRSYDLMGLLF